MKHNSRRKIAKRKYKRLMAALAGAAVVTTAMLPGLPIPTVHAAENTVVAAPVAAPASDTSTSGATITTANIANIGGDKIREHDRDRHSNRDKENLDAKNFAAASPVAAVKALAGTYGFDASNDSFSLQWRHGTEALVLVTTVNGQSYKVHLSKDNGAWTIDSVKEVITGSATDAVTTDAPVAVVKNNAGTFGFDATNDRFSLLSITGGKAIVQVKTSGQTFKVDLERSDGNWVITTIRGIGNSQYPATYRPASLYGYQTLGMATSPVVTAGGHTLYSNDAFAGWTWWETGYPADMKFGVLLAKPSGTSNIPTVIVDKVDTTDFGHQLVLYAYLGSVADKGYGIGIEKVVQTGNDLTVTIRTKSPSINAFWSASKTNDVIPLDRLTLNFNEPIHINFVDQNGTALSSYTLNPH